MTDVTNVRINDNDATNTTPAKTSTTSDSIQYRAPSSIYKIGLTLFYIPLGFDFKDRGIIENPDVIKAIIVSVALIGFLVTLITRGPIYRQTNKSQLARTVFGLWFLFCSYAIIITGLRSDFTFDLVKSSASYAFILMSMYVLLRHVEANFDPGIFWNRIIIAGIISMLWTFYFGRFTSYYFDEDEFAFIDDIRYQILSPALLPLCGLGIFRLSRFKQIIRYSVLLIFIFFLLVISKTRGVLLGVTTVTAFSIFISENRIQSFLRISAIFIVALVISIGIPALTRNVDIVQIWEYRLFGSDSTAINFTFYTRLAEYFGQLKLLFSDIQSAVFGYGFITSTFWDPELFDFLYLPGSANYFDFYGRGVHSTWVNTFFQGGFIAGWIPTATFLYVVWIGFRIILLPADQRGRVDDWGMVAICMTLINVLPLTFASFLIDRIGPVIIGPALVYSAYAWDQYRSQRYPASL